MFAKYLNSNYTHIFHQFKRISTVAQWLWISVVIVRSLDKNKGDGHEFRLRTV